MGSEIGDSLQSIGTRLNGENFTYWSYVMKNFLKGKKMWNYVTGLESKPVEFKPTGTAADATAADVAAAAAKDKAAAAEHLKLLDTWETNNAKVITWINNSVDCSIGMQLAKYEYASEVWDHLNKLYTQSNFAKRYQLEHDIRGLEQNDKGIQEFYNAISNLWDQLALNEPADLRGNASFITYREEQRLVQFLMALRHDFEGIRGSILHRSPLPHVNSVLSELLAEETRLKTHSGKGQSTTSVFAASSKPYGNNNRKSSYAYDECRYCKKKGHWSAQCPSAPPPQSHNQRQQPWRRGNQQRSNTAAVVPSDDLNSDTTSLAEQVQQIQRVLAMQPQAMSAAPTIRTDSSGFKIQQSDWDRP